MGILKPFCVFPAALQTPTKMPDKADEAPGSGLTTEPLSTWATAGSFPHHNLGVDSVAGPNSSPSFPPSSLLAQ